MHNARQWAQTHSMGDVPWCHEVRFFRRLDVVPGAGCLPPMAQSTFPGILACHSLFPEQVEAWLTCSYIMMHKYSYLLVFKLNYISVWRCFYTWPDSNHYLLPQPSRVVESAETYLLEREMTKKPLVTLKHSINVSVTQKHLLSKTPRLKDFLIGWNSDWPHWCCQS